MHRTGLGLKLRAAVENPDAARLMSIDVTLLIALTYAAAALLAGIGGILIAPLYNVAYDMGTLFGIKAFAVAILGGLTNPWGVVIAGLGLRSGGSLRHHLAWFEQYPDRHLHRRDRRPRTGAVRTVRWPDQGARMKAIVAIVLAAVLVGAAAVAICLLAPGYYAYLLGTLATTALVGVGLNVLLGLAGEVSLGQAGFLALGAYGVGILTTKAGLNFWEALPLAVLLVAAISAALSIPALRVTGPYLAMVTIAFGFIVESVSVEWRDLTGGSSGLAGIPAPFGTGGTALLACGLCAPCACSCFTISREARSAWRCRPLPRRRRRRAASGSARCRCAPRPSCWPPWRPVSPAVCRRR